MSSNLRTLARTYGELSSLYKNPTRSREKSLDGKAASNRDTELAAKHRRLLELFKDNFKDNEWLLAGGAEKPALYFKALALLYEIDDYRGVPPADDAPPFVRDLISKEWDSMLSDLTEHSRARKRPNKTTARRKINFKDVEVRSLWKSKILCGVAAVESRRKSSRLDTLLNELNILEAFVEQNLHRPDDGLPSWTMLAFVRAAQARVAKQGQSYDYVQERLLSVIQCLDERTAEIIEKLSTLGRRSKRTKEEETEIDELTDDLVFVRQKQTLSSLFNVGLANLQRGFLHSAEYACQSARLQFRLHGQFFHRLYNELVILSIKRARTYTEHKEELRALKNELELNILTRLKPKGDAGNPKLYLYGLREMAVIQSSCGETEEMLDTLKAMKKMGSFGSQWDSRINLLHARYCYQHWKQSPEESRDDGLLQDALVCSDEAFKNATGLQDGIKSHRDTESILTSIERSVNKSLIDAIESLITYGTVQLFLNDPSEAIKSANAVVELSIDDNPRLLAMGYLVLAEACLQIGLHIEAHRHLVNAKTLENQIDHKYVVDRRRAVENLMPEYLDLSGKNISEAEDLLLGWFIERRSSKVSVNKVAKEIGKDRKTITSYLRRLLNPENKNSPFRHLAHLADKKK